MRASVGAVWRVAAAVAFAATAALAVSLTRGAPLNTTLTSTNNTASLGGGAGNGHAGGDPPRCAPARLDVSIVGPAQSAARRATSHAMFRFPVDFTNASGSACTLSGFPQVSAYKSGGTLVGNAAALDTTVSALRVVLAPGATAHAAIVATVPAGRCRPVAVTGLRVAPPGDQYVPRFVRYVMTACSAVGRTAPVFLHVRPIQPGTGIPAGAKTGRADPRHATPAATSTAT